MEEVIDKHYQDQIDQIGEDEIELKKRLLSLEKMNYTIKTSLLRKELQKRFYKVLDGIIKTGSKIAIKISEKY